MKIIVIDDDITATLKIANILKAVGDVQVITRETEPWGFMDKLMESLWSEHVKCFLEQDNIEKIGELIRQADVVLMDGDLGDVGYHGRDLVEKYCSDKKVLGISTTFKLGAKNWFSKDRIRSNPTVLDELKAMVEVL